MIPGSDSSKKRKATNLTLFFKPVLTPETQTLTMALIKEATSHACSDVGIFKNNTDLASTTSVKATHVKQFLQWLDNNEDQELVTNQRSRHPELVKQINMITIIIRKLFFIYNK